MSVVHFKSGVETKKTGQIRFHVLDKDDKWLCTRYANTEIAAIEWALSEGMDAWSAHDSLSRNVGGW